MRLTPFKVEAGIPSRLWLDGSEVESVKRVSFDMEAGGVPRLFVELAGDGMIKGHAVVQQLAPGSFVLDELDPQELDDEITRQLQMADVGCSVGEMCVRALRALHGH